MHQIQPTGSIRVAKEEKGYYFSPDPPPPPPPRWAQGALLRGPDILDLTQQMSCMSRSECLAWTVLGKPENFVLCLQSYGLRSGQTPQPFPFIICSFRGDGYTLEITNIHRINLGREG